MDNFVHQEGAIDSLLKVSVYRDVAEDGVNRMFHFAFGLAAATWPASRWVGSLADLTSLHLLVPIAFANAVVVMGIYFAFAALTWGVADAAMDQPRDLFSFVRDLL